MLEALSPLTGQYVSADAATSGRRYICPECHAPVSVRAGISKRAYFAHMPGRSGKDCQLYVEGGVYGTGLINLEQNLDGNPSEMYLALRLSEERVSKGWGLELIVPTGGHVGLEIKVDVGGRTEIVRCASSSEKLKSVIAEPQTRDYEVMTVAPLTSAFAHNLGRKCPGLASETATVFGEIRRPGKELAKRVWEMDVGRTYALVWPKTLAPTFPAHLDLKPLKSRSGWSAGLVTLLYPVERETKDWLLHFTGLEIATSWPEIVPVWPALVRRVSGGLVELQPKSDLIVHAGQLTSRGAIGARALFVRSLTVEMGQTAKSVDEPFFHFATNSDAVVELACQEPVRTSLTIDIVALETYPVQSTVELVGLAENGAIKSVGLHESAATEVLDDIRRGTVLFKYLSVPLHVDGSVSTGRNGLWKERLKLSGSDALAPHDVCARLLTPFAAEALAEILCDLSYDLLVDFGAFGRAISIGTDAIKLPPTLSKNLKERLLAYLFQTRGRISLNLDARKAKDAEIISEFLRGSTNVASATCRSLRSALETEIGIMRNVNARVKV